MCDLIEDECKKSEIDLLAACRQSLAHGALLATRYMLAEMHFSSAGKEAEKQLKVRKSLHVRARFLLYFQFFFGFFFLLFGFFFLLCVTRSERDVRERAATLSYRGDSNAMTVFSRSHTKLPAGSCSKLCSIVAGSAFPVVSRRPGEFNRSSTKTLDDIPFHFFFWSPKLHFVSRQSSRRRHHHSSLIPPSLSLVLS